MYVCMYVCMYIIHAHTHTHAGILVSLAGSHVSFDLDLRPPWGFNDWWHGLCKGLSRHWPFFLDGRCP